MSKVTIIRCCGECIFHWRGICLHAGDLRNKPVGWDDMPDLCPLPDLPEKRNTTSLIETKREAEENHVTPQHQAGFNLGWNACLDEITGGNDETPGDD